MSLVHLYPVNDSMIGDPNLPSVADQYCLSKSAELSPRLMVI